MENWGVLILGSAFLIWVVWFNRAANAEWIPIPSIVTQKFAVQTTRGGYKSSKVEERLYIVAGGGSFIGSWMVRYLLARGETKIVVLDRFRPPSDIMKPGVTFVEIDLAKEGLNVELEMTRIRSMVLDTTLVIVYNCSLIRRFDVPDFRADLGVAAAEFLYVSLRVFELNQVIVINVGDTKAHRNPILSLDRIWPTSRLWCQTAHSDTCENDHRSPLLTLNAETAGDSQQYSFSSYTWHQREVEEITLNLTNNNSSVAASATLRVEGFCSGHLGDGLLSPSIQDGRIIMHAPNAPLTIVHVEDVVRGCLSLEYLLSDPNTRKQYSQTRFTIGSSEITSLNRVAEYLKERRSGFRVWNIPASLVFMGTWLMCLVYSGRPLARRSPRDSLLQISPKVWTFARFYTLQIGQIPNKMNERRQRELLRLKNNYSLSQTIDSVLNEVRLVEKQLEK